MFRAGHSYTLKDAYRPILCIGVNKRTAAFRTEDSFSIKSLDKAELYIDLGMKNNFRDFAYSLIG